MQNLASNRGKTKKAQIESDFAKKMNRNMGEISNITAIRCIT